MFPELTEEQCEAVAAAVRELAVDGAIARSRLLPRDECGAESMASAPRPLLIFPCNGNGIEALDCLGDAYRCIGFVDDTAQSRAATVAAIRSCGSEALRRFARRLRAGRARQPEVVPSRRQSSRDLGIDARRYASVIHPRRACLAAGAIGSNVLIMAGVVDHQQRGDRRSRLRAAEYRRSTTMRVIGAWSLIGSNVTIAGNVVVGENCYIGSGTSLMDGLRVGDGVLVGLGSTVIRDAAAGATLAGNPARRLGER